MMDKGKKARLKSIGIVGISVVLIYVVFVFLFYFISGSNLRFRAAEGNIPMPEANSGTIELSKGIEIEQTFSVPIQRLESISLKMGAYYRDNNNGTIKMELIDQETENILMHADYDASVITEGYVLTMTSDTPIENVYGKTLILRISADSDIGYGVTPFWVPENIWSEMKEDLSGHKGGNPGFNENMQLTYNGEVTEGALCIAASGTDYIWTGLHYWELAAAGFCLISAFFIVEMVLVKKNKRSYFVNALFALKKYKFLISQLVARDFKTKYKRSVLGVFWSFLNPLLMMSVQFVVFSTIFKADIPNYPVYLLIGIVAFNFFSESCGMSLTSVLGNASLITKVYIPKYIYPFTRVISSLINLSISLLPLLLVALITGVHFKLSSIFSFYFIFCLVVFSLGLGLVLSSSMVFFRDTQFLWNVVSMIWMYSTPIFYPENIVPVNFRFILNFNPLYHFITNMRMCILEGATPEPIAFIECLLMAFGMFLVGSAVFYKTQDRFILYL